MSIVLRKVQGKLPPLMRSLSGSFGVAVGPSSVTAALCSPLVLMLLAVALAVTWALAHVGIHVGPEMSALAFVVGSTVADLEKQVAKRDEQLGIKSGRLADVFEKAGTEVDFSRKEVLDLVGAKSAAEVVEKVRALNDEVDVIGRDRDRLQKQLADARTPAVPAPMPGSPDNPDINGGQPRSIKSIGEAIVLHDRFAEYRKSKTPVQWTDEKFGLKELKANFLTSAGWAPESTRIPGLVIDKVTRPIQLLDIVPSGPTVQATVKFMEETTRTHAAAERAEAGAYAESSFALTERSETVRSIGDSIPVSDEQLEDVAGVQTYLNSRLNFGVLQRIDGQILIGDGVAPNLTGIKNKAGINTQAKGADPIPDAVYKAMRVIRVTGRAFPNAVVFHPTDWEKVRLLRTAEGVYIWGSPSEAGPERIWGIQVVQSDADAAGSAYVGDFANFCMLYERRGIEIAVGYVNTQFTTGMRTIRAGARVAFAIYRAAAFTQVTGL